MGDHAGRCGARRAAQRLSPRRASPCAGGRPPRAAWDALRCAGLLRAGRPAGQPSAASAQRSEQRLVTARRFPERMRALLRRRFRRRPDQEPLGHLQQRRVRLGVNAALQRGKTRYGAAQEAIPKAALLRLTPLTRARRCSSPCAAPRSAAGLLLQVRPSRSLCLRTAAPGSVGALHSRSTLTHCPSQRRLDG